MGRGYFGVPILLLIIMAMMILPVPAFVLDMFFSFNIALSLVVLLVSIYTLRPLDFAVFPTVILITTLLRLALNIASTRVVLLHGHTGGDAAGAVIEAFGHVVIGGNYAVGLVVFFILVIINFVVVTKGAGRVSEVSARFTLDAMPGKQMAIDADLNAGVLTQEEARIRRSEITQEADFYGSMDGASKFVRGDAVAGILILAINLLGGIAIGVMQYDMTFMLAMKRYALLTIGDGLVSQLPALFLSTASAIMVTRANSSQDMGEQIMTQMFHNGKALYVCGGILAVIGIIPGMPHFAFLLLALICVGGAYIIKNGQDKKQGVLLTQKKQEDSKKVAMQQADEQAPKELGWDDVQPVDILGLEVGYRLIPLVDKSQGGLLLGRIKGVRKKLSKDLGSLMPTIHIKDNLELSPNAYHITLKGISLGGTEVYPDREMAINGGQVFGQIQGIPGVDPAFGLQAVWIMPEQKDQAISMGYTVVDASTVVATHLNHMMQQHSAELLGHEEAQKLLDHLSKTQSKLVESIVPNPVSLSNLLKVLRNLLKEGIPIRDIRTILEALANASANSVAADYLTAEARVALSRLIVQTVFGQEENLNVVTLQPRLEQLLLQSVYSAKQPGHADADPVIEPNLAEKLQKSVQEAAAKQEMQGKPPVLLVAQMLRSMLSRFLRFNLPNLNVLSYNEIPEGKQITVVSTIGA